MMRKKWTAGLLTALLVLTMVPVKTSAALDGSADYGTPGVDYVDGEVIVCVKGGEEALSRPNGAMRNRGAELQTQTLMELGGSGISTFSAGESAEEEKSLVLVSGSDTEDMIEQLSANPLVEYAEPNYIMVPYSTPSDPAYSYQWGLDNTVNRDDTVPAVDMDVVTAWSTGAGSPSDSSDKPVVAVVDSGVDYTHPDLQGIMWDDGESYPELLELGGGAYGVNYSNNGNDTTDPMDTEVGHGTHCASIIASQWDNQEGGSGVSGNAEIMAVKFLGGQGDMLAAIQSYNYLVTAKKAGVNVAAVNNSWGPSAYNGIQLKSVSTAVTEAGKWGIVSCFAAGNSNTDNDLNTGGIVNSPYAVTVGAMDSQGYPAFFSCYGSQAVDVFAPGTQILAATSTDEQLPMNEHQMPAQYLPWIQDADDSYFYEDFEDDEDKAELLLIGANGSPSEESQQASSRGYNSGRGLEISLDQIQEGEEFALEISFQAEDLAAVDCAGDVYLAFAGAFDNAMYGQNMWIQQNVNGSWEDMSSTMIYNGALFPARLRMSDHNWNISSQALADKEFLQDPDGDGRTEFRISGTMKNKSDGAVFHLDNVGFGKKASDYYYSDGTSMAAPMVTGTAALLAEIYGGSDGAAAAEICARLKGGVNRVDGYGLEEKSVSGGFIDTGAAFDDTRVVPVLSGLQQDNETAELTGYFFGSDAGSVSAGGLSVEIASWSEESIVILLPEGSAGNQEIAVTAADGRYGHDYFDIGSTAKGFAGLRAPALDYGEIEGISVSSSDGIPACMAAAGDKIAYVGDMFEIGGIYMEIYDIQDDTWEKLKLPDDHMISGIDGGLCSMAGGKSKLYLLYTKSDGEDETVCIGTYDTLEDIWTSVDVSDSLSGKEALAVYQNQLLAIGGENQDEETGTFTASEEVRVIDPVTGAITGNLPGLPQGRSAAVAVASGDLLLVAQGYDSYMNAMSGMEYTQYENVLVYDGNVWKESDVDFFSHANDMFDANQTLNYAVTAVDGGMMVTGPVKDLGTEQMTDTWRYDAASDSWSSVDDLLYHGTKTTMNMGAAVGNQFYVLSRTGDTEYIFRSAEIAYTDPVGNPGEDPTAEPTVPPIDTPQVDPTITPPAGTTNEPTQAPPERAGKDPAETAATTIKRPGLTRPAEVSAKKDRTSSAANAKTADETPVTGMVLAMGLSVLAGAVAAVRRKKDRK
ncbi:S8 family serine peptidase [Ruminococcus sp. OA3]|uniref:S8 family serine peptidase n=1 Tax=Ruminococcus sp. OA3 TaxID=2914164 RepID=UPI001F0539C8|nr:S8 family serine peptidase [Ruminococcus sp. OA3]MCH1982055.1 S8 family serine peptidase [Ruminococcus sp. OA3]